MALRLFGGGIVTETNVFSPMPTGPRDFNADPYDPSFEPYVQLANAHGHSYVQGTAVYAEPSGITRRHTYENLRDELLQELKAALPLDGVLLNLHGAMVAEGYEDCESDLVDRVRTIVGEEAKIGVLLDLHCDIAQEMIDAADVVITYKEYPHVDITERAAELGKLIVAAASGEIEPTMALFDCRMIGLYATPLEPMRSFVDRMSKAESRPGVLSVSLGHSFPWGDSPHMSARTLAVTDGDVELALAVADEFGREFYALRHEVSLRPLSITDALERALSAPAGNGPVVVADMADNAGGGAASDSTFVLRELLARGVENAAIAMIWDPVAVQQAVAAGVGETLAIRLGGKMSPASGDPLDLAVTVRGLTPDLVQRWPQTNGHYDISCGESAWLQVDGVDVIVNSTRTQALGLEVFTSFGIDLATKHVVVVKSANHFRAAFGPISSEVIYMGAPGALTFDFPSIPYQHLDTNKYPWVDDPWRA